MTSTNNKAVQVKNLISSVFWLRLDRDLLWKYHSGILGLSQPPKKKKEKKKHHFCCFGFKLSWNCCLCLCVGVEISLMCSLFCTLPDCPSTPERSILYNKAFWQTWLEQTVRSDKHRWLWVCVCTCACVSLSASLFMAVVFFFWDVILWLCVLLFVRFRWREVQRHQACVLLSPIHSHYRDREIISSRVEKERGRNWQEYNMVIIRQTGIQNRHSASINMKAEVQQWEKWHRHLHLEHPRLSKFVRHIVVRVLNM